MNARVVLKLVMLSVNKTQTEHSQTTIRNQNTTACVRLELDANRPKPDSNKYADAILTTQVRPAMASWLIVNNNTLLIVI